MTYEERIKQLENGSDTAQWAATVIQIMESKIEYLQMKLEKANQIIEIHERTFKEIQDRLHIPNP